MTNPVVIASEYHHKHTVMINLRFLAILVMAFVTSSCGSALADKSTPVTTPPIVDSLPVLTLTATPLSGNTPLSVIFVATCSACVAYTWSFGDNDIGTGPDQNHVYQSAGTYYPVVAATDKYGHAATGTAVITVSSPVDPATAIDVYCPAGLPIWGTFDGPALLPYECMNTNPANTPATDGVVNVSTMGEFTAALAAAACGQQITLQAGNVFSGHFTIPALPGCAAGNNYLWIVSSALASLPAYGGQTSPCYSGVTSLPGRPAFNCPSIPGTYTAQIITPDTGTPLVFTAGTSGVRIMGIEITRASGTGHVGALVNIANLGVDHIIFDRVWCHGDENQDETTSCFSSSADSYIAAIDSYMNDFYCISAIGACVEGRPIQGGSNQLNNTTETVLKVVNNFLEGAGQSSIELGGGASNTTPADIEVRLNTMFKPLQWNPSDPSYNGGISGHAIITKNAFELKNAQRLLFEGNQIINDWGGFTQDGAAILLTPKSQDIGGASVCPTCFVSNITIRYSTLNTVGVIGEFEAIKGDAGGLSSGGTGWSIHDLVADNLQYPTCYKCGKGEIAVSESPDVSGSQTLSHITVNHVTGVLASTAPNSGHALGLSGALISTGNNLASMVFTNNLFITGIGTQNLIGGGVTANCAYKQTSGANMITACFSPSTFGGNCFVHNGSVVWPGTNVTSVASYSAVFMNYNNGNGGNYMVAAGPCKGAGLDGLDPGANISEVAFVVAGNLPSGP